MEINEFLGKLGLSHYEKQAYIALLRLGRAKSRQISKESKVSYGRIYEILEKLEEKGLISSIPTKPKTFEAIDPKLSFRLILKKKADDLSELDGQIGQVKIPPKRMPEETRDQTIVLHGKQRQMQMIAEMNERAKKEILTIPGIYDPPTPVRVSILRALQRGVRVKRLLRAVTPGNRQILRENQKLGEETRQKELTGLRMKIIDRKEAVISIVDPKTKDKVSIYTTNKDFANSMAIFFESLWEKSKPIRL